MRQRLANRVLTPWGVCVLHDGRPLRPWLSGHGRTSRIAATQGSRCYRRAYDSGLCEPVRRWWRAERPRTRAECERAPRPCPWVSCAYHLYLSPERDTVRLHAPGLEVWELRETCALDVADRGGVTLAELGRVLGVTRERARQIVDLALDAARVAADEEEDGNE